MTDSFRPDARDDAPSSEPSTLITSVSPSHASVEGAPNGPFAPPLASVSTTESRADGHASEGDGVVPADRGSAPSVQPDGASKRTRPKMTLRIPDDEVARPSKVLPSAPGAVAAPAPLPVVTTPPHAPGGPAASSTPTTSGPSATMAPPTTGLAATAPPTSAPHPMGPPITAQRIINLRVDTPTSQIPVSLVGTGAGGQTQASPAGSTSASVPARPPSIALPLPNDATPPQGHLPAFSPPVGASDEDSWTPFQPMVADREPSDAAQAFDIPVEAAAFEADVVEPARALPSVTAKPVESKSGRSGSPSSPLIKASPKPERPREDGLEDATKPSAIGIDEFPEMVFDDHLFPSSRRPATVILAPGIESSVEAPTKPAKEATPVSPAPAQVVPSSAPVAAPVTSPAIARPPGTQARSPSHSLLDADEISVDVEPAVASDPLDAAEIAPEDVVSVEAVAEKARRASTSAPPPPMRARAASVPSFAPPPPVSSKSSRASSPGFSTATVRTVVPPEHVPSKPRPIVIVPPASPLAPPPMSDTSSASSRKRARPWWEELFNDDFIRTMAKISDAQIATEVDFVEESLGLDKGAMVLDLACGTGRHAIELTRRGYQVVGFDLSLAMLAKAADEAQERNQKLNFVQGDMREMTFDGTFDGIYCWNTSFGFFEEEKNAAVVANLRKALKPGGQVLLDVVNRDFVAQQSPSLVWFEGDGCVCMDDMTIDWITSRMKVKRTLMMDDGRSREIEYSIRLYALHELGKLLHDHGFRVAQVSGRVETPGVFFGANSPRTLILAEKK